MEDIYWLFMTLSTVGYLPPPAFSKPYLFRALAHSLERWLLRIHVPEALLSSHCSVTSFCSYVVNMSSATRLIGVPATSKRRTFRGLAHISAVTRRARGGAPSLLRGDPAIRSLVA